MKPGYDARRRNRNIGTAKSGHGQNNRDTIPEGWVTRVYYEELTDPRIVQREIHGREVTFLVEPVRPGCRHACTIDDLVTMLRNIPAESQRRIERLILRQPTRKQETLNGVWGRYSYWASLGRYSGPAVMLESQEVGSNFRWDRSLSIASREELDRLREDGHDITETRRDYTITTSVESTRRTQLYRTLPHEYGHNAHFLKEVEDRVGPSTTREELETVFWRKSSEEKEAFAHRFADTLKKTLTEKGIIPFERIVRPKTMRREGLDPAWF